PLILQTAENAQHNRPTEVQTGPAKRGGMNVIDRHLTLLDAMDPELRELYETMSRGISKRHKSI
ncbi:MAG: DUF2520 domain-containing protein, partial [Flavobacteriales bacterium]|nr:DUF2520 domain-containing protein [Flavobacteriales bacterium]